jgi:O-succinylbenzoate synthase
MKIAHLQVYRYRMPLTEPLTLGAATIEVREGLLIRLCTTDHKSAWGEATPLPGFSH